MIELHISWKEGRKMNKKTVSGIILTLLLACILSLAFNIQLVSASLSVHNIDTGLNYETIQEAIDAPETLDGHTIFVEAGTYYENLVVDKNVSLFGENRDTTILDGSEKGAVVQVTMSSEVTLSNFTIINAYTGIRLSESTDTRIENNDIRDCGRAILFWFSSSSVIKDNTITSVILGSDTGVGILFYESSNNIITENTITLNDWAGVRLSSSHNNTISENKIISNYNGFVLSSSSGNILSRNEITDNGDGIWFLTSSNNNSISNNNITKNTGCGTHLARESSNNSVSGNNIVDNRWGILIVYSSSNNSISRNNIARAHEYGIWLSVSSNNLFHHNNFVDNSEQVYIYDSPSVWDEGYPSGGNYWSDYEERYPDAEELDGSGIWDTPYEIDEDNQDNYPLMEPWTPTIPAIVDFKAWNKGKWLPAYIELPESHSVEDIDVSTVKLNDTLSIGKPTGIGDYDSDGTADLMVKFDSGELRDWLASLGCPVRGGYYHVTLTITGKLADGTPFTGSKPYISIFAKSK